MKPPAQLVCHHRGERLEVRDRVPLHQCGHFNEPCSTALPVDGVRLCLTCPEKTSGPGKPRLTFSEMAAKRNRCGEAKARGEECREFYA